MSKDLPFLHVTWSFVATSDGIGKDKDSFIVSLSLFSAALLSTKAWLKRGAKAATGTDSTLPAGMSDKEKETTDFKQKLQDVNLTEVLVHGYLGIIFGEPGWPYPEVQCEVIDFLLKLWCIKFERIQWNLHH